MSSLTPDDFTAEERAEIEARLAAEANDLEFLDNQKTAETAIEEVRQDRESAHIRIQDKEILDILNILLGIVQQRDIDEPTESPHFIRFASPPPSSGDESFPVALADMTGSGLPSTIPSYSSPFDGASVENGDLSANEGGWELWHYNPGSMSTERDPDQPSAGELGSSYPLIVAEFGEMQNSRLHAERGSFVLLSYTSANISAITGIETMIQERNDIYRDIGFPVGGS